MRQILNLILAIITVGAMSCGRPGGESSSRPSADSYGDTISMAYARNLSIIERDGYTEVSIRNPWDTTKTLHRYILVERGGDNPIHPENATVIEVPLKRPVVYSGVHVALIDELGHLKDVSGVCDVEYLFEPSYRHLVKESKLADCGNSMAPDLERIFSLGPDAVLLSPYEETRDNSKLERAGIPVVECADYMEESPLGRAEWMRFYGRLFGAGERADSLFASTAREYEDLRAKALGTRSRPAVMFDRVYGGAWYVPEKRSTTGRFVEDAGGRNPFAYIEKAGSAALTSEEVLIKGGESDFWFIRHAGEKPDYNTIGRENPVYIRMRPYKEKKIYQSDTSKTHVFEDAAFHPQWLLADFISILHPELGIESPRPYYTPLQ